MSIKTLQFLTFIVCLTNFQTKSNVIATPTTPSSTEDVCYLCEELKKDGFVEDLSVMKKKFENDNNKVLDAIKEIENELKEISEKVWWLPRNDLHKLKNETDSVREAVLKSAFDVKEIDSKANSIRTKIDVYEAEKETNKAKAVEQWNMLTSLRKRLHNLEKTFLDAAAYADDMSTVAKIDQMRVLANEIANKLKFVPHYYAKNGPMSYMIHKALHEIAVKKVEIQTKNISKKSKCLFLVFFCE